MLGMIVVNMWKTLKVDGKPLTSSVILDVTDILAYNMIHSQPLELTGMSIATGAEEMCPEIPPLEAISNLSSEFAGRIRTPHTKLKLEGGKQVRYIWCSRVNLCERKATLKCVECNKGFCRDENGCSCWLHHVALGGVPKAPKRGTAKHKVGEI